MQDQFLRPTSSLYSGRSLIPMAMLMPTNAVISPSVVGCQWGSGIRCCKDIHCWMQRWAFHCSCRTGCSTQAHKTPHPIHLIEKVQRTGRVWQRGGWFCLLCEWRHDRCLNIGRSLPTWLHHHCICVDATTSSSKMTNLPNAMSPATFSCILGVLTRIRVVF